MIEAIVPMEALKPFAASILSGWIGSLILVLFAAGLFSTSITFKLVPVILVFNCSMTGFMLVDKYLKFIKRPVAMAMVAGSVTSFAVVATLVGTGLAYFGWLLIGPADGVLFICLGPMAGWAGGKLALKTRAAR